MNQIYRIFCGVVLAILLLVMVVGLFGRDTEQRPELCLESFLDGSYFQAYQSYFAETFPGRDRLIGADEIPTETESGEEPTQIVSTE